MQPLQVKSDAGARHYKRSLLLIGSDTRDEDLQYVTETLMLDFVTEIELCREGSLFD